MADLAATRLYRSGGRGRLPILVALCLGVAPALAASPPAARQEAPSAGPDHLFGEYLAGRHAQQLRDFTVAASSYEKAIGADPEAPELISRTFLMEVCVGHFERARALAQKELKLDPGDAIAELVLVVEALKAGDTAAALKHAAALPSDGVHRFIGPFALAWTRKAAGDLAGADSALQGLDKFNGFEPLKVFQLALLYDYAGKPDKAQQYYDKALADSEQLNWRLTDAVANFDERHGRDAEAKALYQRFIHQNSASDLALSVAAMRPSGRPQPIIRSPADGLAEALFDLASVLNQAETIDLALVYDRFALAARPQFPLAQLLLADILSAQNKPEQSLAVLAEIPSGSPYSWSARLRSAVNLDTLERSDEAIAQLKAMATESTELIGAQVELGDMLREKKRFAEAVEAYDAALRRAAATGLPERWTLFYDRGVALERSGQWKRAEADLLHALELKPDQPMVLNYLGYSWIDRGENLDRGLKMIEKAVELRPDDGYIVDSLGWAHYRMGDYAGAVQYLEKATELVPEDATINDHLGDAYWQTGRLVEARYQWRRALQFGPEEDEVKPIEAKLERGLDAPAAPPKGG
jgi:tetratricopeptide (TPR) repeat protein